MENKQKIVIRSYTRKLPIFLLTLNFFHFVSSKMLTLELAGYCTLACSRFLSRSIPSLARLHSFDLKVFEFTNTIIYHLVKYCN